MEYSEASRSVKVIPGLLTDLLLFLYAPPGPRPYTAGRCARLPQDHPVDVNGMEG